MNQDLQKELEEISPMLAKLPKESFEAPEGYFESFSDRMLARVKTEQSAPSKSIVRPIQKYTKYMAAAMILVFMGLSIFIFKIKQTNSAIKTANINLTTEDIYLEEIDEATLVEFANTNTSKVEIKADVDEYQNYIDEETIIEEL